MKLKSNRLTHKIHLVTLRHNGKYICHLTYNKGFIMTNLIDIVKTLATTATILIGLLCWLVFSVALLGCSNPTQDPSEEQVQSESPGYRSLPPICGMNDSTVKVFDKSYRPGKTLRATVYIDPYGVLYLRWPDGVQEMYDEGQIFLCKDKTTLWEIRSDLRGK